MGFKYPLVIHFHEKLTQVTLDPTPLTGSGSRVNFIESFSNSASPGIGMGIATGILGANGISIPGWLTDLINGVSFFCSGITPTLNANASVDVGGYYEIHSLGDATIEINYPVSVSVTFPEMNSFGCGDLIRIETAYTILDADNDNKLIVEPPFFNQEIGPILRNLSFNTSIGVDAHVGYGVTLYYPCLSGICSEEICGDKKYFDFSKSFSLSPSIPSLPPLVNIVKVLLEQVLMRLLCFPVIGLQ